MAGRNVNRVLCYVCERLSIPRQMSRFSGDDDAFKREIAVERRRETGRQPLEVTINSRLCFNCNRSINVEIRQITDNPACLRLNVLSQTSSHTCLICDSARDVHRLSIKSRMDIFLARDMYVPENVRCCAVHLDDRGLLLRCLLRGLQCIKKPYVFKGPQLLLFLQHLRAAANENNEWRFEDENSFTDEEFRSISPISKEQFQDLFLYCDPVLERNNRRRHINKKDLLTFLCKLRQGLSDDFLKVIFNYPSRQSTSLAMATVRKSLAQRFVQENIGFDAITRAMFIDRHVPPFANHLYNNEPDNAKAIVYIDGTYSYIPKCSNFRVLRQSYCVHKGRHLLKPALIVAPDGYILAIQGPYFSDARNSDAIMLRHEFERDIMGFREWIQEGDIVVVDRGYRDAVPMLEELGIQCEMPALLPGGRRQLSTEEANKSRLVTKTRWIVEARNGHIKTMFKFFANTISIIHARNLGDFYRIVGGVINRYHTTIQMEGANARMARQMIEKARTANIVQARVEEEHLERRNGRWVQLSHHVVHQFPHLSLQYLRDLTVGVYQINLAPSYIQDKLLRDGEEELHLDELADEGGFLRVRVYSRFRNATKYQIWISYRTQNDEDEDADFDIDGPILGYYCTCKAGARTLGTCAHVACILWYLGYARHENNIPYPSRTLTEATLDAGDRAPQEDLNRGIDII